MAIGLLLRSKNFNKGNSRNTSSSSTSILLWAKRNVVMLVNPSKLLHSKERMPLYDISRIAKLCFIE